MTCVHYPDSMRPHIHLHRHTMMTRDGLGQLSMCHRFGTIIALHWRATEDSPWVGVPIDKFERITMARDATDIAEVLELVPLS